MRMRLAQPLRIADSSCAARLSARRMATVAMAEPNRGAMNGSAASKVCSPGFVFGLCECTTMLSLQLGDSTVGWQWGVSALCTCLWRYRRAR